MELQEKHRSLIFWTLQIAGWGILNLLPLLLIKKLSLNFMIFSFLTGMFSGIVSTNLLRQYLKRRITFDDFGLNEFGKVVFATFCTAIFYGAINFILGYLYGKCGPVESEMDLTLLKNFDSFWLVIVNSLIIIAGWVTTYLLIKLFLKLNADRLERSELNAALKQSQLNTLKGQINPHFMFNSLNNIRGLMLEDVERSRDMLTKLSEMLRYSLTKNDVNSIALSEELEMVENYVALSKIQMEDRLKFKTDIAPETLDLLIPPMIIQLLVENASKHGISKLKSGGKILLKTAIIEKELFITVTNTGTLSIAKDSTQLGLKNIKQRLRLLYGEKASFSLDEMNGEVISTIIIPL